MDLLGDARLRGRPGTGHIKSGKIRSLPLGSLKPLDKKTKPDKTLPLLPSAARLCPPPLPSQNICGTDINFPITTSLTRDRLR